MSSYRRLLSVWVGLLLLSMAAPLHAQGAGQRSIEKLSGNVYRALNNNNHSTVFLVTDDGIVLADPLNREFAEWFKAEAARQFKVPVKYVIYSHHHWDHVSGGGVFADTAQFIAQANLVNDLAMPAAGTRLADIVGEFAETAALDTNHDGFVDKAEAKGHVTDYEFSGYDADRDGRLSGPEVARGPVSDVQSPGITYGDELEIKLGGHRIHVSWMGRMNHCDDMSLITFPDDNVLFAVDYAEIGRLPYKDIDYANGMFPEWMAALKRTESIAANYKVVATGHMKVGTAADLTALRGYVDSLHSQVAAGIARGENLEQLKSTIKMEQYSSWTGYKPWLELNIVGMYHFLTDGVAVAPKPGARAPARAR